MGRIKVLIVDDSPLFREFLIKGLEEDDAFEVVGTAGDPYEARDNIIKYNPDVMTCDIEMPRMDGIEFVTKLIPQYPIPVVMISSLSDKVFDALNAGAVDFVAKPSGGRADMNEFVKYQLLPKIKAAVNAKLRSLPRTDEKKYTYNRTLDTSKYIIAIGASTGGTEAICEIVKSLDNDLPGIVVTQHIPEKFSTMFAERLNRQSKINCKEAEDGDIVKAGWLYVAPGDRQMKVVKVGSSYKLLCRGTDKVNGHCPSVDVLFESVAEAAGKDAMGIILTGMGNDGAKGLLKMKEAGATTIGQDKGTCVVYGMPMEAYKLGAVKHQLPLNEIPRKMEQLLARIK